MQAAVLDFHVRAIDGRVSSTDRSCEEPERRCGAAVGRQRYAFFWLLSRKQLTFHCAIVKKYAMGESIHAFSFRGGGVGKRLKDRPLLRAKSW
jgi:hypothetical protein